MKYRTFVAYLTAFGLLSAPLLAQTPNAQNALSLALNSDGLRVLSKEIQDRFLQDVYGAEAPNVAGKGPLGIDVSIEGIRYTILFDSLNIRPFSGKLGLDLKLRKVLVHAHQVSAKKKVLVTLSASCQNVVIEVGKARPFHVSAHLVPTLDGSHVKVAAESVNFPLNDDNFEVTGPSQCSGALGIGSILKWVVNKALNASERKIQETLEAKIAEMTPAFAAKIDELLHQDFPMTLPGNLFLEQRQIVFTTRPYSLAVDANGISFNLSVGIAANQEWDALRARRWAVNGNLLLGKIGINPNLPNEFFQKVLATGSRWVDLSDELAPGLSQMLGAETLSSLLPDLKLAQLSSQSLRGKLRFASAPVVSLDSNSALVGISLPKVSLALQAQIAGEWRDYYTLHLAITSGVTLGNDEDGALSFELQNQNQVRASGEWASGYLPADPTLDTDTAEILLAALLDVVHSLGPVLAIELPVREIGGKQVTVHNPHVSAPFLKMDIIGRL